MELTDTHSHIYLEEFDADREEVLQSSFAAGVTRIFLPNVDASTYNRMLDLAVRYPDQCFPMAGLHPTSVGAGFERELDHVKQMLNTRQHYGIGEIGIDLYWDQTFRAQQEEAFRIQLGWASERNLPVVIHVRNSHDETISIIRHSELSNLRGVFHCFGGSLDQAAEITGMGFHLGIGGVSTFKSSELGQVLPQIDPRWILLETDAPWLAPVPFRGQRNQPAYLVYTAQRVAGIYGMTTEQIAEITTENSKALFGV